MSAERLRMRFQPESISRLIDWMPNLAREGELGNVRARKQPHPQLLAVSFIHVIGSQPLSELHRGSAHDVVEVRIVRGMAAENFNANCAFLDLIGCSVEGLFDNVLEEGDGTFARAKNLVVDEQFELRSNHVRSQF